MEAEDTEGAVEVAEEAAEDTEGAVEVAEGSRPSPPTGGGREQRRVTGLPSPPARVTEVPPPAEDSAPVAEDSALGAEDSVLLGTATAAQAPPR